MKHVLILSAIHSEPEVIKYTLGTWLETYDGSYKVTICMTVQSDYAAFSPRLNEITDMPNVEILTIDPINFYGLSFEHSRCHTRCLRIMMEHCRDIPFTHVAILDHDLEFKKDFIKWALEEDHDWVLNLFEDRTTVLKMPEQWQYWAPKPSIWHTVFNRKVFDLLMEDFSIMIPDVMFGHLCFDTASKMFEVAVADWGVDVVVYPEAVIKEMVIHLWSLSFTYGRMVDRPVYDVKIVELMAKYTERFPNGIDHLLAKLDPAPSV